MPDDQKEEDSEVDVGDEAADTVKSEGVDHTNEATLRMSERYADPTADLRIISSDGVELKLHSYHLNSASATFRSMLSLAANDEQRDAIEFTDPELETSTVLHQLFDIMLEPEAVRLKHRRIIDRTIRLAQKWDVPSVLRTIRQAIRQDILMETGETLCLFHCAVSMKDYQGIALLLQYRGTYQWGLSTTPEERTQQRDELARLNGDMGAIRNGDKGDTMMNQHLFIPGSMSASRYAEIPPLIHWAIARAVLLAEQESGMKNQWKLVGKHFLQLMLEAYPQDLQDAHKRKIESDDEAEDSKRAPGE